MKRIRLTPKGNILVSSIITIAVILLLGCSDANTSEKSNQDITKKAIHETEYKINFNNCWSGVGSTGILDQGSRRYIKFGPKFSKIDTREFDGTAYLTTDKKGIYHLRFPVNQQFLFKLTDEDTPIDVWEISLKARYKVTNRHRERVYIRLNRYVIDGTLDKEKVHTMMVLDSDNFSPDPEFQTQSVTKTGISFDFRVYGYYIDVQLIKKTDGDFTAFGELGTAIGIVQLCAPGPIPNPSGH